MNIKQLVTLLIVLVIGGIIAVMIRTAIFKTIPDNGTIYPSTSPTPIVSPVGQYCTMEAKLCPDGSYVGRVAPSCDFAMCPSTPQSSATLTIKIGEKATGGGVSINPQAVIEDSRCGLDVQCIQAGTVRVKAEVTIKSTINSNTTVSSPTFTLNIPLTVDSKKITLISVSPAPYSGRSLKPSDYTFVFDVK